jgi:hypothetical protein
MATATGAGVRAADIDTALAQVKAGLEHLDKDVVVLPTNICYLTSCTTEEFHAS